MTERTNAAVAERMTLLSDQQKARNEMDVCWKAYSDPKQEQYMDYWLHEYNKAKAEKIKIDKEVAKHMGLPVKGKPSNIMPVIKAGPYRPRYVGG